MEVKTSSGYKTVNKRSTYAKFLLGYVSSGAFSGHETLAAAWTMARQIRHRYPSMCHRDIGKLVGANFKHRPSDAYLEEITGVAMKRN